MDAIIPVLTSCESVFEGEVEKLYISPKQGNADELSGKDLHQLLAYLVNRFDEVHPPGQEGLNIFGETAIKAIEEIPIAGGILAMWVERWLKKQKALDTNNQSKLKFIHDSYKGFFLKAKNLKDESVRLEEKLKFEPTKKLPPSSDSFEGKDE